MTDTDIHIGNEHYIDREFAWLAFNVRVLEEARNPDNPLLERLKFLGIVATNLDEFFEIRVASLLQKEESGISADGIARLDTVYKLQAVLKAAQKMVRDQYRCWNMELLPLMEQQGIRIHPISELDDKQLRSLYRFYRRNIYHLLTPIKVDPAHPFPGVLNKALCMAVLLRESPDSGRENLGVITIPRSLPRILRVPQDPNDNFVFLYDVIRHYLADLFKGYEITGSSPFRITRNSNLYLEEEEVSNLLKTVEAIIKERRKGDAVRLEIDRKAPKRIQDALMQNFEIRPECVFRVDGPVNLSRLMSLYKEISQRDLKYAPAKQVNAFAGIGTEGFLEEIKKRDIMLHHPFDSFSPVVQFIESVSTDPQVIAIKQTLYRTSEDSPIMFALLEAARRGKDVVVVVELKARFDEKSNIDWAKKLEQEGVTVVYGLVGLKTHCKLSLVIRKEEKGITQYAHIGTGNYNPDTARLYTDIGIFTHKNAITNEVSEVFNYLTSHSRSPAFQHLLVGPVNFLQGILERIHRERDHAKAGRPAQMVIKMNALIDKEIIQALYEASQAGVKIRLIVRGICSLRPGIPGLSEGISVHSIVGRYLEHSRIFYFENNGEPDIFIGSGDLMERNLRRRVEVLLPVWEAHIREDLMDILAVCWADNVKCRSMRSDGRFTLRSPGTDEPVNCQDVLQQGDKRRMASIRNATGLFASRPEELDGHSFVRQPSDEDEQETIRPTLGEDGSSPAQGNKESSPAGVTASRRSL